jgi:P4 family phage/plasmid primase-like protien
MKMGVQFDDISQLLKTPWDDIYKKLHIEDKNDLFFTLGLGPVDDQTTRTWLAQKVIMFDVDGADFKRKQTYIDAFTEVTGLPPSHYSLTWTGGGYHFLVALKTPIEAKEFFTENKVAYQFILEKLTAKCKQKAIPGSWDPNVFAPNFMSRLPGSLNSKYEGEKGRVILIQDSLIDVEFDLSKISGLPKLSKEDMLSKKELAYFKIDTQTALTGCEFLRYSKEHAKNLTEPEWFATLSILSRFEKGRELAHEYSKPHPDYNESNTNQKLDYIQKAGFGPRTCASIESMFPGCRDCKYFKKVRSPVQIKGDRFIATRESGFSIRTKKDTVEYQQKDLMLHFEQEHPFVFVPEMKSVYTFDGKKWEPWHEAQLKEYAQLNFQPYCQKENPINEFSKLLYRTNVTRFKDIFDNRKLIGKINLQNGILDVESGELIPHSSEYGFQTVLNFDFNPNAKYTLFEKMIEGITCGDKELQNLLQEWFGYVLSGCEPLAQKIFIANGEGENGKSKLFLIIKSLLGGASEDVPSDKKRYYTTTLSKIDDNFNLIHAQNKDLLVFEEVPQRGNKETWERIKDLCDGGEISDSYKGRDLITFKNRAKIMMTCNTLPNGTDPTHGYFRKLIIFPFNADFSDSNGTRDPTIAERVIESELPGVLNWAIQGYHRLRKNKWVFSKSKAINDVFEDYKQGADPIGTFLKDWLTTGEQKTSELDHTLCEQDGKIWVNLKEVYDLFKKEQEDGNAYQFNFRTFVNRLRVFLKKEFGGSWVKVSGSDYCYQLVKSRGREGDEILATLDRRIKNGVRGIMLHSVRFRQDPPVPGF